MFMIINERFQEFIIAKVAKWKSKIQPKDSAMTPAQEHQEGDLETAGHEKKNPFHKTHSKVGVLPAIYDIDLLRVVVGFHFNRVT